MNNQKRRKQSFIEHFSQIPDPRIDRKRKYPLIEIIVLTVCGVISGCDNFVDIQTYGESKIDWLRQHLAFSNGIPSHDTLGRVFSLLNSLDLQRAFHPREIKKSLGVGEDRLMRHSTTQK